MSPPQGGHIVLVGDSILDNGVYTEGEPDVVTHLRPILPGGWRATLLAVDGSTTHNIPEQLSRLPEDATHAVVSVGGNDALTEFDLIDRPCKSVREALLLCGTRATHFERNYRRAIAEVVTRIPSVTICTIYEGNLPCEEAEPARVALMLFNDAIIRVAHERRCQLIDLRLVCTEAADYANPIEPSGRGGAKIARAIVHSLGLGTDT